MLLVLTYVGLVHLWRVFFGFSLIFASLLWVVEKKWKGGALRGSWAVLSLKAQSYLLICQPSWKSCRCQAVLDKLEYYWLVKTSLEYLILWVCIFFVSCFFILNGNPFNFTWLKFIINITVNYEMYLLIDFMLFHFALTSWDLVYCPFILFVWKNVKFYF